MLGKGSGPIPMGLEAGILSAGVGLFAPSPHTWPAVQDICWQPKASTRGSQQRAVLLGLPGEGAMSKLLPGGCSAPCLLLSTLLFPLSKIWVVFSFFLCGERTDLPLGRDHLHSLTELLCMATLCRRGAKQTPALFFFCHNPGVVTSQHCIRSGCCITRALGLLHAPQKWACMHFPSPEPCTLPYCLLWSKHCSSLIIS